MKKRKGQKYTHRGKQSLHVLARVRREIGTKTSNQWDVKETLGLSPHTLKSIVLGRLKLSLKSAEKVSRSTGVAVDCLIANDPAPLLAVNGKPWNREVYERFKISSIPKIEQTLKAETTRLIHYQRIFSLKAARVLFAAYAVDQTDAAIFRLKEALASIENTFVEKCADKAALRRFLEEWETSTQVEMGRIKASHRSPVKRSAVIGKHVHEAAVFLYRRQERT
jgi:hypothetical protein